MELKVRAALVAAETGQTPLWLDQRGPPIAAAAAAAALILGRMLMDMLAALVWSSCLCPPHSIVAPQPAHPP